MIPLLNPPVLIALLIIGSVFVLVGAAIFGLDKGVLVSMGRPEFARGLITYLFALVTIGTAVVLVVSVLGGAATAEMEEKFQRGKEILALLLGVFGTIVGYYFGAEKAAGGAATDLNVTAPLLAKTHAVSGESISIIAAVSGGTPPYSYSVEVGKKVVIEEQSLTGTWIQRNIDVPAVDKDTTLAVTVRVSDSAGRRQAVATRLEIAKQ
jgi:hypothetical protein